MFKSGGNRLKMYLFFNKSGIKLTIKRQEMNMYVKTFENDIDNFSYNMIWTSPTLESTDLKFHININIGQYVIIYSDIRAFMGRYQLNS